MTRFIRTMHPKTEIQPDPVAIKRILQQGWVGQEKIHGHRVQIHLPPDPQATMRAFNRHGNEHRRALDECLQEELRRLFGPLDEWLVLEAEWLKPQKQLFLFDLIKKDNKVLHRSTYTERYELLPQVYRSDHIATLPLLRTAERCLDVLDQQRPKFSEGLVFKSTTTRGFADTAIIRCRRQQTQI